MDTSKTSAPVRTSPCPTLTGTRLLVSQAPGLVPPARPPSCPSHSGVTPGSCHHRAGAQAVRPSPWRPAAPRCLHPARPSPPSCSPLRWGWLGVPGPLLLPLPGLVGTRSPVASSSARDRCPWRTGQLAANALAVSLLFVPNPVVDGRVCIRDWREERPRKEKEPEAEQRLFSGAFKTRICWFFAHHPDGCVLPPDRCPFAHGPGELRPAPARKKRPALSAAAARPVGPGVGGPRPEGTVPAP